jgi:hypothetical protein
MVCWALGQSDYRSESLSAARHAPRVLPPTAQRLLRKPVPDATDEMSWIAWLPPCLTGDSSSVAMFRRIGRQMQYHPQITPIRLKFIVAPERFAALRAMPHAEGRRAGPHRSPIELCEGRRVNVPSTSVGKRSCDSRPAREPVRVSPLPSSMEQSAAQRQAGRQPAPGHDHSRCNRSTRGSHSRRGSRSTHGSHCSPSNCHGIRSSHDPPGPCRCRLPALRYPQPPGTRPPQRSRHGSSHTLPFK